MLGRKLVAPNMNFLFDGVGGISVMWSQSRCTIFSLYLGQLRLKIKSLLVEGFHYYALSLFFNNEK